MKFIKLNVKRAKLKNKVKGNTSDSSTAASVERRNHSPNSAVLEENTLEKHGFVWSVNCYRVAYAKNARDSTEEAIHLYFVSLSTTGM